MSRHICGIALAIAFIVLYTGELVGIMFDYCYQRGSNANVIHAADEGKF